jgi:hypothetical protein
MLRQTLGIAREGRQALRTHKGQQRADLRALITQDGIEHCSGGIAQCEGVIVSGGPAGASGGACQFFVSHEGVASLWQHST